MTIEIKGIVGDALYRWYDLARGTAPGHSVEWQQFVDRFRADEGVPANTLGEDNEFYVDTVTEILYFKISGVWTSVGGGGGGGSALSIFNEDDTTTAVSTAATSLTFVGDGVVATDPDDDDQVVITIDNPSFDAPIQNSGNVVVNVNPGNGSFTLPAATRTLAGVMIGTDKARLDDLNTYDLTAVSGSDERTNPSRIIFSSYGNSFTIATDTGGNLHTFTPTDPSTGDFAEQTIPFSGLDAGGEIEAELTFSGGVDGNSIVQKNGVTIQTPDDYDFNPTTNVVTIEGRSFNGEEITVINGGILTSFAGDRTFTDNVTIEGNLTVDGNTTLGNAGTDTVTVTGALTTNGASDIEGEVSGIGITDFVNGIVSQHGSGTLHIHDTATSPGGVTTPDGNPLVTHLPAGDDYREAISFYTYDDTMVWRFVGTNASLRSQFNKGDYYATNGYFSTTEVESDVVQSGQLLLLCTGRTQETARLDVYFRVIADGIMPAGANVGDEWRQRVSGSAEYVLNTAGLDLTCLLYTSPSPRDRQKSRMPSSA